MRIWFIFFAAIFLLIRERNPSQTATKILYGDRFAPLHIVLFEEFACPCCTDFFQNEVPWILETLVNTGKGSLTIVPVAFFDNSLPAAKATCALMAHQESLVYPFIEFVSHLDPIDPRLSDPALLLTAFREHGHKVESKVFSLAQNFPYKDVDKNMEWLERVEGDVMELPSLFMNGKRIHPLNRQNIIKSLDGYGVLCYTLPLWNTTLIKN